MFWHDPDEWSANWIVPWDGIYYYMDYTFRNYKWRSVALRMRYYAILYTVLVALQVYLPRLCVYHYFWFDRLIYRAFKASCKISSKSKRTWAWDSRFRGSASIVLDYIVCGSIAFSSYCASIQIQCRQVYACVQVQVSPRYAMITLQ
jgi:hypothetical protein